MPDVLHRVEAAKAQPDDAAMLLQSHFSSADNDWVRRQLPCIFPLAIHFDINILLQKLQSLVYLCLPPCLLRLCQLGNPLELIPATFARIWLHGDVYW